MLSSNDTLVLASESHHKGSNASSVRSLVVDEEGCKATGLFHSVLWHYWWDDRKDIRL